MSRAFQIFHFNPDKGTCSPEGVANTAIKPSGSMPAYSAKMYDAILFLVTCKTHRKVLFKTINKGAYFLPFFPLKLCDSWKNQSAYYLDLLFRSSKFKAQSAKSNLLQVNQIRLPRYSDYLFQLVMVVEVDACSGQCTASDGVYKWYAVGQVTVNDSHFWSPEPYLYVNSRAVKCIELSIAREMKANSKRWTMAMAIGYKASDLTRLYANFLQLCYPARFMNEPLFAEYLARSKMSLVVRSNVASASRLYNSFCAHTGSYITFKDFFLTMVALDRKCVHGGIGGELRTRSFFRYYAKPDASAISYPELVNLYEDIDAITKKNEEKPEVAAEKIFKREGLDKETQSLSMEKFIELVGGMVIRGTSSIYRSENSPLTEMRTKTIYKEMCPQEVSVGQLLERKPLPSKQGKNCPDCDRGNYRLAIHSLTYTLPNGPLASFQEMPSGLTTKYPRHIRERSLDAVNPRRIYNQLLNALRRFSAQQFGFPSIANTPAANALKWEEKPDRDRLMNNILQLCINSKEAFKNSPRVVKCASPVYVFGDTHGNFKDLMIYDHHFWRMGPSGFVANCIFLGDYVDRGSGSVEVTLYLLCMKMLLPERFHLLRGNHEVRPIQVAFTFLRECIEKFGSMGTSIWDSFNQVFDCMPQCGIIDEQVFCAHGGIPTCANRIEDLYYIPVSLNFSESKSKSAWEMLWNDPVTWKEYRDYTGPRPLGNCFPAYPNGFLPNMKRGTAFYYSEDALDSFFDVNDLNLVIRAHEVREDGFTFEMDGKMITIFSCSNYCGAGNQSGVVFIDDSKVRIIKIETMDSLQKFLELAAK